MRNEQVLSGPFFQNQVLLLVQDLADSNGPSLMSGRHQPVAAHSWTFRNSSRFHQSFHDVAKWLSDMYDSTLYSPGALRCLMGYIVDITIVLEILFWLKTFQPTLPLKRMLLLPFGVPRICRTSCDSLRNSKIHR